MSERKFTDEEIINALTKCCADECHESECCFFDGTEDGTCVYNAMDSALDLIYRQLKGIDLFNKTLASIVDANKISVSKARKDAIKEFAERLKDESEKVEIDREGDFVTVNDKIYYTVADWCKETSDNLGKEMVGGQK